MDHLLDRIRGRIAEGRPCDHPGEWLPVQPLATMAEVARIEAWLDGEQPW